MITDARSACPHGHVGPWYERPCNCKLIVVGFSEVACHIRAAGKVMWASPRLRINPTPYDSKNLVQLYGLDKRAYSAPITWGEAGYHTDAVGSDE